MIPPHRCLCSVANADLTSIPQFGDTRRTKGSALSKKLRKERNYLVPLWASKCKLEFVLVCHSHLHLPDAQLSLSGIQNDSMEFETNDNRALRTIERVWHYKIIIINHHIIIEQEEEAAPCMFMMMDRNDVNIDV